MEHIADRLMRYARPTLIVLALFFYIVFIISYGLMLFDAITSWPLWASVLMLISHVIVFIGLSFLYDHQQAQRSLLGEHSLYDYSRREYERRREYQQESLREYQQENQQENQRERQRERQLERQRVRPYYRREYQRERQRVRPNK